MAFYGTVPCDGNGAQILAGLRVRPFRQVPRLSLDAELAYTLARLEGDGWVTAEGNGLRNSVPARVRTSAESDFDRLTLLVGIGLSLR